MDPGVRSKRPLVVYLPGDKYRLASAEPGACTEYVAVLAGTDRVMLTCWAQLAGGANQPHPMSYRMRSRVPGLGFINEQMIQDESRTSERNPWFRA